MKDCHLLPPAIVEALEARIAPAIIFGIANTDNGQKLVSFDSAKPPVLLSSAPVTGLGGADQIVGVDFRPANGALYAVATTNSGAGKLYTLNLATGAATQVGGTFDYAMPFADSYDIDFNPQVDRLRVVSSSGQNFRVDPNTGAVVDFNQVLFGNQPDTNLSYATGDANVGTAPKVSGLAYTNSIAGATTTQVFAIDFDLDILAHLTPPNNGTLSTEGPLKMKSTAVHGFDVRPGAATGLAALEVGGVDKLYSINLDTGAAKLLGAVGPAGTDLVSIAALPSGLGIMGKMATYRDVDGDLVTVTTTKGAFTRDQFTFSPPNAIGGVQLYRLTLPTGAGLDGAAITLKAKGSAAGGNGQVDVGYISADIALASLTVKGDLGRLNINPGQPGVAVGALSLNSFGVLGLITQEASGVIEGVINGNVNTLTIPGVVFGSFGVIGALKTGSLGLVAADFSAGSVTGSLKISSFTSIGFTLVINNDAKSLTFGSLGGAVVVGGAVGSLTVKTEMALSTVHIAGHANPTSPAEAVALGSFTVGGSLIRSDILVGFNSVGMGINPNVTVGKINVAGSWFSSSLSAGIAPGLDAQIGSEDDTPIGGGNGLISRVGSILIKGAFTAPDTNGIVAGQIGTASVGGAKLAFSAPTEDRFTFGPLRVASIAEVS